MGEPQDKTVVPRASAALETEERLVDLVGQPELNQANFNALIKFSEQTEPLGKALDKVRKFFLSRACKGDFVSHNGKTVNVSGPGAERILSSLGLMGLSWSLTNRTHTKDEGSDNNGKWYTHWYSGEARIGGINLGIIESRCGSRDKFFGYAHGKWKDLSDVRESDIIICASRGLFKELVKVGLGLRNIPLEDAEKMGLDLSKIAKVEYGDADSRAAAEAQAPDNDGGLRGVLKSVEVARSGFKDKVKKTGPWTIYAFTLESGAVAETFDKDMFEGGQKLKGKKVVIMTKPNKNPRYSPEVVEVRMDDMPPSGAGKKEQAEPGSPDNDEPPQE